MEYVRVTSCLPFDGDHINPVTLATAADRGQKAHKAIHLLETVGLKRETLSPILAPYVAAYERFKEETGYVSERMEWEVKNERHKYIGHPDCGGHFTGLSRKYNNRESIGDLKCTVAIPPTVGMQTSAYDEDKGRLRWCLQLKRDETYRLEFLEDKSDFTMFLAFLRVYRWKRDNGYNA